MGGDLEVTVYIDRDLGISITKTLVRGSTVLDLKQQIALDDPTGRTSAGDFTLVGPAFAPLDNTVLLSEALRELTLEEQAASKTAASELREGTQNASEAVPAKEHGGREPGEPWASAPGSGRLEQQAVWEVVGGADKGGILVRAGPGCGSPQLSHRLATGAFVAEAALEGERLQYRLLAGAGPATGWVSLRLKERALLRRSERQPAEFREGDARPTPSEPHAGAKQRGAGSGRGPAGGGSGSSGPKTGEPNPFELLGVPLDATETVINKAFRKASLKVHPDHCPDDPEANVRFQELCEAKDILLDPNKRRLYELKHNMRERKEAPGDEIISFGTERGRDELKPITLCRELGFTERLAVAISDQRTNNPAFLPLRLFAAKDGKVRVGAPVVELALMIGADPRKLERLAAMDAVCEGEQMPQLRQNGEDDEDLPERSGDLHRAIITISNFPQALSQASPAWLRKNNTLAVSQKISMRLTEVQFEADILEDPVMTNALHVAQDHTSGWWSSG